MINQKTVITCAVTGNLVKPDQTPYLPISPKHIAEECLAAANAGASQVHIHVRDPESGRPSMGLDLYREVVDRIRDVDSDLIINLTTGPGGRFVPGDPDPKIYGKGTTLVAPEIRVEHVLELKPDVCSLDCNTMNSGADVVMNTPKTVRRMAELIRSAGVMPEIEVFDSGDIHLAKDLISDGVLNGPGMWTFVHGVKYGFNSTPETMLYARNLLPSGAFWSAFGIGRMEFPLVAQSWLLGGHVRVGMEDNIYLSKGVLAKSNAELVSKAVKIIESLGGEVATATEARDLLGLVK